MLMCHPWTRQLFGAVKRAFPGLKTMATVRWVPPVDDGLNIDIWVTLYSLWNSTAADAFRRSAKGREAWACKDIDAIPLMVVLGGAGCWVLGGVWWPGPVRISTQCRSPGTHITNKQTNKHIFNTSLTAFQALAPLSPPSNKLYPP